MSAIGSAGPPCVEAFLFLWRFPLVSFAVVCFSLPLCCLCASYTAERGGISWCCHLFVGQTIYYAFINKISQRIHRTNIGSSLPSVLAVVVFRETQKQQRAEGMSMTDQKTTTCRMTRACDILLLALPPNKQTSSFIHIPHTTSRRSIPDRVGATLRSLLSRSSVHRPLKHRKRKSAPLLHMIA